MPLKVSMVLNRNRIISFKVSEDYGLITYARQKRIIYLEVSENYGLTIYKHNPQRHML
jgi:hypothetical protein